MRGSIILARCAALGLCAFGANTSLPGQNNISTAPPEFEASSATHRTWADPQASLQFPKAFESTREIETVSAAPPTRRSFMATWDNVPGATGYLLDVSTSDSFSSYVEGYHELDVGDVTARCRDRVGAGYHLLLSCPCLWQRWAAKLLGSIDGNDGVYHRA